MPEGIDQETLERACALLAEYHNDGLPIPAARALKAAGATRRPDEDDDDTDDEDDDTDGELSSYAEPSREPGQSSG